MLQFIVFEIEGILEDYDESFTLRGVRKGEFFNRNLEKCKIGENSEIGNKGIEYILSLNLYLDLNLESSLYLDKEEYLDKSPYLANHDYSYKKQYLNEYSTHNEYLYKNEYPYQKGNSYQKKNNKEHSNKKENLNQKRTAVVRMFGREVKSNKSVCAYIYNVRRLQFY